MFVNTPTMTAFSRGLTPAAQAMQARWNQRQGTAAATGSTKAEWDSEIEKELAARPGMTRMEAVKRVAKRRPELRERLVAEANR